MPVNRSIKVRVMSGILVAMVLLLGILTLVFNSQGLLISFVIAVILVLPYIILAEGDVKE